MKNAVSLHRLSRARLDPVETTCEVALRLYLWEVEHVRPAARRYLGTDLAAMTHYGSYSCRTIAGSRRMSRHSQARAIDIAAFTLADGRRVSLSRGWVGTTGERAFLRAARDGACDAFSTVLSPDYNAAHADHFHMDIGGWGTCR